MMIIAVMACEVVLTVIMMIMGIVMMTWMIILLELYNNNASNDDNINRINNIGSFLGNKNNDKSICDGNMVANHGHTKLNEFIKRPKQL